MLYTDTCDIIHRYLWFYAQVLVMVHTGTCDVIHKYLWCYTQVLLILYMILLDFIGFYLILSDFIQIFRLNKIQTNWSQFDLCPLQKQTCAGTHVPSATCICSSRSLYTWGLQIVTRVKIMTLSWTQTHTHPHHTPTHLAPLRAGVIEFLLWQRKPPRAQPPSTILKQTPPLSKRVNFLEIRKFVLQERQFGAKALRILLT